MLPLSGAARTCAGCCGLHLRRLSCAACCPTPQGRCDLQVRGAGVSLRLADLKLSAASEPRKGANHEHTPCWAASARYRRLHADPKPRCAEKAWRRTAQAARQTRSTTSDATSDPQIAAQTSADACASERWMRAASAKARWSRECMRDHRGCASTQNSKVHSSALLKLEPSVMLGVTVSKPK